MEEILERIHVAALRFLVPLSPDDVYKTIVDEAIKLVDARYGSLTMEQNGDLVEVYSTLPFPIKRRKRGNTYEAFKTSKVIMVNIKESIDTNKVHPQFKKVGIRSNIFIPLSYKKKSFGVLIVNSYGNKKFTSKEKKILKLYGSLATLAIRKTHLYDEARKALEARDLFISMAAHELRTPLTTINGYVQLLSRKFKDSGTILERWTQELTWESFRMAQLLNELLSVIKIQQGKFIYSFEECSLDILVSKVVYEFQMVHPLNKIIYKKQLKDKKDLVIGDREKLLQVITNLLDNAAKFSDQDSEILINLKYQNPYISLSIEDHGKGIPKKDLPHIFDGFFIGKNHTVEGMGLGLYLAKNIVKNHHGSIKVKSKINKGTNIEIKLPNTKI